MARASNRTKNTQNLPPDQQHARNMEAVTGQTPSESGTIVDPQADFNLVIQRFKASRKYARAGYWDTWRNAWKLYNNERIMVGYDGNTDAFTPETFTIMQAIKAHIVGGNLTIRFLPRHIDQRGDVTTLQDLFNYAWDRDFMDAKIDSAVDGMLATGNRYIFTFVGEGGFPASRVVDAKDCFFDTQATNYWNMRFCGFRYTTTLDELEDEMITNPDFDPQNPNDPKNEPKVQRYKNLDQVRTLAGWKDNGSDKTAKEEREEMTAGSILEDKGKIVEVIVYFDYDKMITIANRKVEIENVDTPFYRATKEVQSFDDMGNPVTFTMPEIPAFLPVAPFRDYIDNDLWYAKGEIEVIGESQERLNDVVVQKSDNLSYILNRMWALDPAFAQKLEEIQNMPGAVFTIPPGALEAIPTPPIGTDADNEIARIKDEMRSATAADEIIQGQQVSGATTATEVKNVIAQAGTRFGVKLRTLENEGMRILAENMWKVMQIYINEEIAVRVEGDDMSKFTTYNPGQYLGEWDVKIQLAPSAEAIKEMQRQMAMQFYLLASKQPFVDQRALFSVTAMQQFDKTKAQIQELMMPPMPTPPIRINPRVIEDSKLFDSLYPSEQAQWLAETGIEPDPKRMAGTGQPAPPPRPQNLILPPPPASQDFSKIGLTPNQLPSNIPGVPTGPTAP
jgi:hypothetical protein